MAEEYIRREDALDALTADALERNLDSVMTDTASRYRRAAQRVVSIVPTADVRTSEEPESLTYIPPEERSGVDDG